MTHGIMRINAKDHTVNRIPTPDSASSYGSLFVDSSNNVWATSNWTKHTLVRFNAKHDRFDPIVLKFKNNDAVPYPTLSLTQSADGYIWLASARGDIIRFHPNNLNATLEMRKEDM